MDIEKISSKLKSNTSQLYVNRKECTLINNVKLYKQNEADFKLNTLYVISALTLDNLFPTTICANIICIGKMENPLEKAKKLNINMLLLNDNLNIEVVANKIQTILDKNQQLLENEKLLFDLLAEGKGLQQIINRAYEMLGNMVLLSDASMGVILYAQNAKMDENLRKWIYQDRLDNYNNFYIKNRDKRGFEKSYKNRIPIYIDKSMDTYAYLASDIFVDDKVGGHLTLIESEKYLEEDDYEIVSYLCKIISLEMHKDRFICNSRGFLYEYLFLDLLEGRIKDPVVINDRIKSLEIELQENLYVFTVSVDRNEKENTKLPYIRNLIEDIIKNGKAVIYDDRIVCVITMSGSEKPMHKIDLENFKNFLKTNKMYGGLSYCFHDLHDLQKYYKQSLKSIEMGIHLKKEEIIFSYEDCAKYHMLDVCSKNKSLKDFCHPSVLSLLKYDSAYNTNFTKSLYIYLICEKKQVETSKMLHIHRSTLIYRIKKAEEIMNVNLKDSGLVFNLLVSFKILEFIGEIEFIPHIYKE